MTETTADYGTKDRGEEAAGAVQTDIEANCTQCGHSGKIFISKRTINAIWEREILPGLSQRFYKQLAGLMVASFGLGLLAGYFLR